MNTVFATIAPVFIIILLGYVSARVRLISEEAASGVSEFVLKIGIPALLFRTMVDARPPGAETLQLWGAFFGAAAIVWLSASFSTRWILGRPPADQPVIAMAATFGNTVLLGIPIGLGFFGQEAATPMALLVSIHSVLLWFTATLHAEWVSRSTHHSPLDLLKELATNLLTNPIILAILAGTAWRQTGIGLGEAPRKVFDLLAQAGVPGALFALGLGLKDFTFRGQTPTLAVLSGIKLFLMPALVWVLAAQVFMLPPVWTGVAVLFAACPTGVNAFLFAKQYDRVVNSVAGGIAIGTLISVGTISLILLLLHPVR